MYFCSCCSEPKIIIHFGLTAFNVKVNEIHAVNLNTAYKSVNDMKYKRKTLF